MIETLQKLINNRREDIIKWVDGKRKEVTLPIYSSFDIRDNGVKASIVDSNLFPAGFNNLTQPSRDLASVYFKEFIPKLCKTKNVLIIPEAHTRNLFYLSNLNTLKDIISSAGYNTTLGSIREDIDDTIEIEDSNNQKLILEKMKNIKGILQTKNFKCGLILLNNDFSVQAPDLLENVKECITPPLKLGWLHRRKYNHFKHFCKLIKEFSNYVDIDEWLPCPMTREVNNINFFSGENIDKVAEEVDKMIEFLNSKYKQYGIKGNPYVYVKDNSGTYGMGILNVSSGKEILELNSKQRRKMKSGKERSEINSIIVQDGISTKYKSNGRTAEPVIYSVAGKVVGGFMRLHDSKDDKSSLNAPGAKFDVLLRDNITRPIIDFAGQNKELSLYTVLANIASVAIGKEMEEIKK